MSFYEMSNLSVYPKIAQEILDKYPDSHLYYHSEKHILDMVDNFSKYLEILIRKTSGETIWSFEDPFKMIDVWLVAILFHDIIYKVGSDRNEYESRMYCIKFLQDRKIWGEKEYDIISGIIYHTIPKHYSLHPTVIQSYIRDLDWLAFSDFDKMLANEVLIANEAMRDGYTPIQIFSGRVDFMNSIKTEDIYKSPVFSHLNDIAHKNITERLEQLNNLCKWISGKQFIMEKMRC